MLKAGRTLRVTRMDIFDEEKAAGRDVNCEVHDAAS